MASAHKYQMKSSYFLFQKLFFLNSAKLPGIGNCCPSAQSQYIFPTQVGFVHEAYSPKLTNVHEFKSVWSRSPTTIPKQQIVLSIICLEAGGRDFAQENTSYGYFFYYNLFCSYFRFSYSVFFKKSYSLTDWMKVPEVFKNLDAQRYATTFFIIFYSKVSIKLVANASSDIYGYELLSQLQGNTIIESKYFLFQTQ